MSDVLRGLYWIVESAQCDCAICRVAMDAIAEIERLHSTGDALAAAVKAQMWATADVFVQDWEKVRNA